jgi:hypothetical protein
VIHVIVMSVEMGDAPIVAAVIAGRLEKSMRAKEGI